MSPAGRRAAFALAAALAGVAVLGGCGDSGGATLTKADFVAKGNEICTQAHDQFAAAQENPPNTAKGTADLQRNLIDISENELNDLSALPPPSELQPAVDRYLQARRQGITVLQEGLRAAENSDAQAYSAAMAKLAASQVHRLKLAQAAGLDQCSRPGGASTGA